MRLDGFSGNTRQRNNTHAGATPALTSSCNTWSTPTCKALPLRAVGRFNGLEEDGHARVAHALALVLVRAHNDCEHGVGRCAHQGVGLGRRSGVAAHVLETARGGQGSTASAGGAARLACLLCFGSHQVLLCSPPDACGPCRLCGPSSCATSSSAAQAQQAQRAQQGENRGPSGGLRSKHPAARSAARAPCKGCLCNVNRAGSRPPLSAA